MTAHIHLLPVIRITHDHEGALTTACDLTNVVRLDRYRRSEPQRYLLAEYSLPEGAGSLGEACVLLWLEGLRTAAKIATTPLWPGGIDDLKW